MDGQLNLLKDSLRLLSLPFPKQKEELPEFVGDIMSDIIDEFFNSFLLLPQLIAKGLITDRALQKIVFCYVQTQVNIRHPEWSKIDAFQKHDSWNQVRKLAGESLSEL